MKGLIDGTLSRGAQVSVAFWRDASQIDHAVGVDHKGHPMRTSVLHDIYCGAKPLLGLAVGLLVDRHGIDIDAPISDMLDEAPPFLADQTTLRMALAHQAGLDAVSAIDWRMSPRQDRLGLLPLGSPGPGPAYSEVLLGLLVAQIIRLATDVDPARFVTQEMLAPLGLKREIIIDPAVVIDPVHAVLDAVRAPVSEVSSFGPVAFLSEAMPVQASDIGLAFGALASARGMASLLAAVGAQLEGGTRSSLPSTDTLRDMLQDNVDAAPVVGDYTSPTRFAGSMQMRLDQYLETSAWSERAIGHVGGGANCVGVVDPDRGLAWFAYSNGALLSREQMRSVRTLLSIEADRIATSAGWT